MSKEAEAERIDEASRDALDDVRKGKARRFVMICKGASIVSLVVYKKGNLEKYKKQAKEVGKGVIYHGVVEGRGPDITFKMSIADGFDKDPVKTSVVRSFLEDEVDFKAKPTFEFVAALGPTLDADDPAAQRYFKLREQVQAASVTHPDRADEMNKLLSAAGTLIENDEVRAAEPQLGVLDRLLASLGTASVPPAVPPNGPPVPPTATSGPTAPTSEIPSAPPEPPKMVAPQLLAALNKLTPAVKSAVVADPSRKDGLLKLVAQFQSQLKSEALDEAKSSLLEIGKLAQAMNSVKGTAPPTSETESGETESEESPDAAAARDEFEAALAMIEGRYLQILRGRPTTATQLRALMDFANGKAEAGDFAAALKSIERLDGLLDAAEVELADALASALVDEADEARGVVAFRKSMVIWQTALSSVRSAVETVRSAVLNEFPDTDVERLDEVLGTFDRQASLHDALIDCVNAADPDERRQCRDEALALADAYGGAIDESEAIRETDANGFVPVQIAKTLRAALKQLKAELKK